MKFKDLTLLIEDTADPSDEDILAGMAEVEKTISLVHIAHVYHRNGTGYIHISEDDVPFYDLDKDVFIDENVRNALKYGGRWYRQTPDSSHLVTVSKEDADKFINHWVQKANSVNMQLIRVHNSERI